MLCLYLFRESAMNLVWQMSARPTRTEREDPIKRQREEIARLREQLTQTNRERDHLKRPNARLKQQLNAARGLPADRAVRQMPPPGPG